MKMPSQTRTDCNTRRLGPVVALAGVVALLLLSGCSSPFKPPIRVGTTSLELSPLPPFLPKRMLFRQDLSQYLDEPVAFELMQPRQIRVHMGTGRLKFAMLSAADYAEIASEQNCRILAVPKNCHNQTYQRGLIIVAPKSSIQSLAEAKGLRFHFLPKGNVLNEAALGALLEAGIVEKEVDKGILGLELDTSHISSLEVAKSVVLEDNVAGVIDEADYNSWPDTGGSFLLLRPSKEQVRVIGKTVRVPEGPFVVSNQTDHELEEKVRKYLLDVVCAKTLDKQLVVAALGCTGFAPPIDPKEYEPYFEIHRKLHPAEPESLDADTQPAEETAEEPTEQ